MNKNNEVEKLSLEERNKIIYEITDDVELFNFYIEQEIIKREESEMDIFFKELVFESYMEILKENEEDLKKRLTDEETKNLPQLFEFPNIEDVLALCEEKFNRNNYPTIHRMNREKQLTRSNIGNYLIRDQRCQLVWAGMDAMVEDIDVLSGSLIGDEETLFALAAGKEEK